MTATERRGMIRRGGRTERVRQAVADTVLDLVSKGETEFNILDVVRLSGVARSTIHARWPTRAALIAEALSQHTSSFHVDLSGNWKKDLEKIAFAFREFSARPLEIALTSLMALANTEAAYTQQTIHHWGAIADQLSASLRAAKARGEIRRDVDPSQVIVAITTIISGLIVLAKQVPDDAFLKRLVQIQIRGCAAPPK